MTSSVETITGRMSSIYKDPWKNFLVNPKSWRNQMSLNTGFITLGGGIKAASFFPKSLTEGQTPVFYVSTFLSFSVATLKT